MPVVNRIADFAAEMTAWRRHLHAHPELGFDCHATAAFVSDRLRELGADEVREGVARTGVVAVIDGRAPGDAVGLRADMDALPIEERTGLAHASRTSGRMHACGHDGHTAMLLGAARYLAETRNFAGRAVLLFQPAEENGGGGKVMVDERVLDRYGIREVYALHNAPGMPQGAFATSPGPFMAAVDTFDITVRGRGGHAALPHDAVDPIMPAVAIVQAIQTISSRNSRFDDDLVISVTMIHAGTADNVIPDSARICGTVRTFDPRVRELAETRLREIARSTARAFRAEAEVDYAIGYPPSVNDAAATSFAADVAREISGPHLVDAEAGREMGSEDFSYMLRERPGALVFLGQGEGPGLHDPHYDFNDAISPIGASFFARLVERALPLTAREEATHGT